MVNAGARGEWRDRRRRCFAELIWDLSEARTSHDVDELVLVGIHRLIGGELSNLNVVDLRTRATHVVHYPGVWLGLDLDDAVTATLREHPAYLHFIRTMSPAPFKISDMYSVREFKRTSVYADVFAPNGIGAHQLHLVLRPSVWSPSEAMAVTMSINRAEGRDFSENDRELAADIQNFAFLAYQKLACAEGGPCALSVRELEILRLMSAGATRVRVARHLAIQPGTVGRHLSNAYRKLDASGLVEAVAKARRLGLI